ncbi:MAG: DUF4352 domain-containing protein [Oscillospiraceae bacterium]|nr:DUF4352 domain-containing protein [Oscillospiraceae bacterium]
MKAKRILLLACSLAILAAASGCSNKDTVKPASGNDFAPAVTTRVTQPGNVGEMAQIGGVEVTLNKAYISEYQGAKDDVLTKVIFLDVTVTNNSDENVDANMLTSFEFHVDGEYYDSSTLYAISCTRKQFGEDANMFTDTLEPGESQTGYIPAEIPDNFQTVELFCLPLGGADESYDPSRAITYTFSRYDFTEIQRPPISRD